MKSLARARVLGIVFVTLSLVMISALPMSGAAAIPNNNKWALLIGIDQYGPLCGYHANEGCWADVARLHDVLVGHGWSPSHIMVLLNSSATEANILAGIEWLTASSAGGMVFFYFDGHGTFGAMGLQVKSHGVERWQQNQCICPYDVNTQTFEHAIMDVTLAACFSDCKAKQTVMMFDCCYSGGFVDECGIAGRLMMCSAATNEMCCGSGYRGSNFLDLNGSVYTHLVLKALAGAGDYNGNGVVSLEEAAQYAINNIKDMSPGVNPVTYDDIAGETYL